MRVWTCQQADGDFLLDQRRIASSFIEASF
jgi:hypothetical protein